MKRACPYCGRIHDKRNECGRANQHVRTEESKIRSARTWKKVKQLANERDGMMCVFCFAEGRINTQGLETHHIVPLHVDPARAYELENLVTLCRTHHEEAETLPPGDVLKKIQTCWQLTCLAGEERFPK